MPIFSALSQLRTDWPNRSWSWDGRLPTVVSSFAASLAAQAQVVMARALPLKFDATTIASAPPAVLALVERSGGLRGNQLAFCSGEGEQLAFGLWWPWGGGENVSLRIGLIGAREDAALAERLRTLFGVEA